MSRDSLKKDKNVWPLVQKMERNTKALVKVISAMEYVITEGGDGSVFNVALYDLVQQRRNLRLAFEAQLKKAREQCF